MHHINHYQAYINLLRESIQLRIHGVRKYILKKSIAKTANLSNLSKNFLTELEDINLKSYNKEKLFQYYNFLLNELKKKNLDENFSVKFFFNGKGCLPYFYYKIAFNYYVDYENQDESLIKDSELTQLRYRNSEILMIQDNFNSPYLSFGDYVIYIWQNSQHIESLNKTLCVIECDNVQSVKICTKISSDKFLVEDMNNRCKQKIHLDKIAPIINIFFTKKYRHLNFS